MDACSPPITKLLFHCATGKLKPSVIEKIAQLVGAGGPDHHSSIIGQKIKAITTQLHALYTLPRRIAGALIKNLCNQLWVSVSSPLHLRQIRVDRPAWVASSSRFGGRSSVLS